MGALENIQSAWAVQGEQEVNSILENLGRLLRKDGIWVGLSGMGRALLVCRGEMDVTSRGNNLSKVLEAEYGEMTDLWGQSESCMEDVLGEKAQEVGKGQKATGLWHQAEGFFLYPVGSQQISAFE